MIYIKKNSPNNIVLEVTGRDTSTNWIFKFTPEWAENAPVLWWSVANTAPSRAGTRWGRFVLQESPTGATGPNATGAVNLGSGQWKYEVFGSNSPINFQNLNIYTNLVDQGRMYVE